MRMPLPTANAIELVAFMPTETIDPIRVGDGYYPQSDGQVAAKPYKLFGAGHRVERQGGGRQVRLL